MRKVLSTPTSRSSETSMAFPGGQGSLDSDLIERFKTELCGLDPSLIHNLTINKNYTPCPIN